jgi:streptomycin 6-kinase
VSTIVPELVRQRAMTTAAGRRWLDELPEIVASLAGRWELGLGAAYAGGTAAYVVAATDRTGRACVVKIAAPAGSEMADTYRRSVFVHRLASGRGCAELLASDDSTMAMLLERLGPNLHDLRMPVERILPSVAATLRSFWRVAPEGGALPTAAEQAAWLAGYITESWKTLGRPCERDVVARAVTLCEERAASFDRSRAVVVHGDAHGWNTLDAGNGTFKLVDPEGLLSEPAHDLGILMREYNEPLLAGDTDRLVHERAEQLASWCDVDPVAVWQWGFIERVSTGLANLREFEGDEGLAFLEVARRCR